jgi:6-phosphogluconate dehydrogenase
MTYDFGMIGLGTMGANLVLNMSDHNFSVAGYDKDVAKLQHIETANGNTKGFTDIAAFVQSLSSPKIVMLLVPAGPIVDAVINDLKPHLQTNDIIVDCGNSHFTDTQRRINTLKEIGLHFFGMGVSGGEKGARFGPSIMPGGDANAFKKLEPMLTAIAAKTNNQPCTAYMGNGAAGHYVKMVHNGIEYAMMQLIAETYHVLKSYVKLNNEEIVQVFKTWNEGKLQSFLVEITSKIFTEKDGNTEAFLIDKVKDTAKQKGTGAWTSQDGMAIGSSTTLIDAAVSARILSGMRDSRIAVAAMYDDIALHLFTSEKTDTINLLEDALYTAFVMAYAQGFAMLQTASAQYKFEINLKTVATIWRGGCIIRAALLEDIMLAFDAQPDIKNILESNLFVPKIATTQKALRKLVISSAQTAIPVPCFAAALNYFDGYKSAWLPANLIQAQRDFFGAHTFERLDISGSFHHEWDNA